jgi:hypothetical protein
MADTSDHAPALTLTATPAAWRPSDALVSAVARLLRELARRERDASQPVNTAPAGKDGGR